MMVLRDSEDQITGFVLPVGVTVEQIRAWVERFTTQVQSKNALQQRRVERFEGRSFAEDWDIPTRYANISSNSTSGDFDVGVKILELIRDEGRQTIDELHKEFGAVDVEPLTLIVNSLRNDHYLQDHIEHSGEHTLELVTKEERKQLILPQKEET